MASISVLYAAVVRNDDPVRPPLSQTPETLHRTRVRDVRGGGGMTRGNLRGEC